MHRILISALLVLLAGGNQYAQERWKADTSASRIEWEGRKITGVHHGTVQLKEGWISFNKKNITGGEFIVDMTTVADTDLTDAKMRGNLEKHLKSDDFFGVEKYPVSRLTIKSASGTQGGKIQVKGEMTIKGQTHPVEFTAVETRSGDKVTFTADITIDRTLYDIRYGSGKFFSDLGDRAILDDFKLSVVLVVIR